MRQMIMVFVISFFVVQYAMGIFLLCKVGLVVFVHGTSS